MINFTIHGEPKSKLRPKISTFGSHARMYQPNQNIVYENLVKLSFQEQVKDLPAAFMDSKTPLSVEIVAYFSIPKSTSKKKHTQMLVKELLPIKKPDIDNLAKTVLDSLNGIAYHDDAQVCKCSIEKYYSDRPRIEVLIEVHELIPFE
jgi:Holliday junction resolvase RusA-like endonuclease